MPYLILGVVLLIAGLLALRLFANADPAKLAKGLRYGAAVVLVVIAVFLAVTGRRGFALPLIAAALGFLRRWRFPAFGIPGFGRPSPGRTSEVETDFLSMTLDHDSGELGGVVRKGPFHDRALSSLTFDELMSLLAELQREDLQGAALLETYLDRTQGAEWRERVQGGYQGTSGAAAEAPMTRDEAYRILGLKPGAGAEDIKAAHRDLMKKVHPDHGGSPYLAAKINQAKDLLLEG